MSDLAERLRIKAYMIRRGQRAIDGWSSDTGLMLEASVHIDELEAELATMRENFEQADDVRALYVRSYNSLLERKKYE